jgi:hypothetical protein
MPAVGYVVISTQPSRADAELLAGLLRSGGMKVAIEGADDAEYPAAVAGGYLVTVPAERAVEAQQLLARAEHVDPTDPASSLDVGLPVDEDVRDYLAWKRGSDHAGDGGDVYVAPPQPGSPEQVGLVVTGQQAPRLPLLPVLGLVALVVALVVLLH